MPIDTPSKDGCPGRNFLAVVASLLYVGFEIQRNTKVGLASNRQEIAARAQELALYSGEARIYRLLFDSSDEALELTEAERDRLTAYVGALLRTTEEALPNGSGQNHCTAARVGRDGLLGCRGRGNRTQQTDGARSKAAFAVSRRWRRYQSWCCLGSVR